MVRQKLALEIVRVFLVLVSFEGVYTLKSYVLTAAKARKSREIGACECAILPRKHPLLPPFPRSDTSEHILENPLLLVLTRALLVMTKTNLYLDLLRFIGILAFKRGEANVET